jgi:hypothetical protein
MWKLARLLIANFAGTSFSAAANSLREQMSISYKQRLSSFYSFIAHQPRESWLLGRQVPDVPDFSGLLSYAPSENYLNSMFKSYFTAEARNTTESECRVLHTHLR